MSGVRALQSSSTKRASTVEECLDPTLACQAMYYPTAAFTTMTRHPTSRIHSKVSLYLLHNVPTLRPWSPFVHMLFGCPPFWELA